MVMRYMVKLVASYDREVEWYFSTMDDCEKFKKVFRKNGLNIIWDDPIKEDTFPEVDPMIQRVADQSPKKRAKKALLWGYGVYTRQKIDLFLCSTQGKMLSDEQRSVFRNLKELL